MQNTKFNLPLFYIIFIKTVCICIIIRTDLDTVLTFKFAYKTKEIFEFVVDKILVIKNKLWFMDSVISILSLIANKQ